MTKQDLLDKIDSAKADKDLKDMVRAYVEAAYGTAFSEGYTLGFSEGMTAAITIHNQVLDLFKAKS